MYLIYGRLARRAFNQKRLIKSFVSICVYSYRKTVYGFYVFGKCYQKRHGAASPLMSDRGDPAKSVLEVETRV